jgi:SpoVK/Ycf46/Vps4 family AAA+-type ATPase
LSLIIHSKEWHLKKLNQKSPLSSKIDPLGEVVALWVSRMLVEMDTVNDLTVLSDVPDKHILRSIGLEHLAEQDIDRKDLFKVFKEQYGKFESAKASVNGLAGKNIQDFGSLLGLTVTDMRILTFAIALHSNKALDDTADGLGTIGTGAVYQVISKLLRIPLSRVRNSLSAGNTLSRAGVLKVRKDGNALLRSKLHLMSDMEDLLFEEFSTPADMVNRYFSKSAESSLCIQDFAHIDQETRLVGKILAQSKKLKVHGTNILVHGTPGTGKTELARVLTKELGFELLEISHTDEDGDPLYGNRRFSAYQLCQEFLKRNKKSIVLFDEIEDVFPSSGSFFFPSQDDKSKKAWINHVLESNPVPAIWISNKIDQIDPAFIRRFDYVLNLENPPRKSRLRIIENTVGDLGLSQSWMENLSHQESVNPALINKAAKIAKMVSRDHGQNNEQVLEDVINSALRSFGNPPLPELNSQEVIPYDMGLLNADYDIDHLAHGLKRHPTARICLYGPPGTGKTEFGNYLASELDMPIVRYRASQLLDKYVGESEKNIAKMFRRATREDAILMLDEADSFLRERENARTQWEVTQVNELLTQMEDFQGVFLCSTNLVDNLDHASIRRFDLKIKLDYLLPRDCFTLFASILDNQGYDLEQIKDWEEKVNSLSNITAGDFATCVRQNRIKGRRLGPKDLFHGLLKETEFKKRSTNQRRPIGFVASLENSTEH